MNNVHSLLINRRWSKLVGMTLLTMGLCDLRAIQLRKVAEAESDSQVPVKQEARLVGDQDEVTVEAVEVGDKAERSARKETPWLGIATEEASDTLGAQLGLEPGIGLVVMYVATNSPAGKAGLQKHDVLVQFDDQSLVHPAQLRKLVRMHKEGDEVKLTYYRGGKKETATATLAKTNRRFSMLDEESDWEGDLRQLGRDLKDLPIKDAIREQMHALKESLGNIKVDQKNVQVEVRRSMDEARKAIQEALRGMSNVDLGPVKKALEEVTRSTVNVNNDATVTVQSSGHTAKSIMKTDDSGTIVLLSRPKLRLTAHDRDGKLIFDGEIQTDEQRAKVPRELWERVEPLLKKMGEAAAEEPESKNTE